MGEFEELLDEMLFEEAVALMGEEKVLELLSDVGLIPLYRCPNEQHQHYGLYSPDRDRPDRLVCGCLVKDSTLAGYE